MIKMLSLYKLITICNTSNKSNNNNIVLTKCIKKIVIRYI